MWGVVCYRVCFSQSLTFCSLPCPSLPSIGKIRKKAKRQKGKKAKRQKGKKVKRQKEKKAKLQKGKKAKRQNGTKAKSQEGKKAKWQKDKHSASWPIRVYHPIAKRGQTTSTFSPWVNSLLLFSLVHKLFVNITSQKTLISYFSDGFILQFLRKARQIPTIEPTSKTLIRGSPSPQHTGEGNFNFNFPHDESFVKLCASDFL